MYGTGYAYTPWVGRPGTAAPPTATEWASRTRRGAVGVRLRRRLRFAIDGRDVRYGWGYPGWGPGAPRGAATTAAAALRPGATGAARSGVRATGVAPPATYYATGASPHRSRVTGADTTRGRAMPGLAPRARSTTAHQRRSAAGEPVGNVYTGNYAAGERGAAENRRPAPRGARGAGRHRVQGNSISGGRGTVTGPEATPRPSPASTGTTAASRTSETTSMRTTTGTSTGATASAAVHQWNHSATPGAVSPTATSRTTSATRARPGRRATVVRATSARATGATTPGGGGSGGFGGGGLRAAGAGSTAAAGRAAVPRRRGASGGKHRDIRCAS